MLKDRVRQGPRFLRPADLFRLYGTGASVFASPHMTTLARGVRQVLACNAHQDIVSAAQALLSREAQRCARPMLMGAIPFAPGRAAHMFVPAEYEQCAGMSGVNEAPIPSHGNPPSGHTICMKPSPQAYCGNVCEALRRIDRGELDKVVLSRSLQVSMQVDVAALLRCLASRNPHGYTFAVELPQREGERRTLVGASPELLLARRGRCVVSNPLAGSVPRSDDAAEDALRAWRLLGSDKDRREHALVVHDVARRLRPYCKQLHVPAEPSLLATPTMWHLSSELRGELADPATTSLTLALALHPTPAVCGYPTEGARAFIEECEGFDRGFFTGLVGWCDAAGDGEWAVTIRCAEVGEHSTTLYAGAGIVAGSQPHMELAETSAKLRTMLAAMGLDDLLEAH